MSVNKNRPHVLILPEDRANRRIINGFHLALDFKVQRQFQPLPEANGWENVLQQFRSVHVAEMDRCPDRFMVLVIDFDGKDRLESAKAEIRAQLQNRVFILGVWTEPEQLNLGPLEQVGMQMAKDCREGTDEIWNHELLRHNTGELRRMREQLLSILFPR